MSRFLGCVMLSGVLASAGCGGTSASEPMADDQPSEQVANVRSRLGASDSWTMVTNPFPEAAVSGAFSQPGTLALLTDGRVLVSGSGGSNHWYTLTPDANGSYENGSWAPVGDSPVARLFHPAFMLRDGRFWSAGGEYVSPGTNRARTDLFDPITNTWSPGPDMPEQMWDTPAALLADGRVLTLSAETAHTFVFSSYGTAPSWAPAAPWNLVLGGCSPLGVAYCAKEGSSLLLPDGSVLVGSYGFQRYVPASDEWVDTGPLPGGGGTFLPPGNPEIGAAVLLHDGRAMVLGSNSKNGLFTPPATPAGPGGWALAADTPAPYSHGDAAAAVEPDGKVLTVVSTNTAGASPAAFYEYAPANDSWTEVSTPFTFTSADRTLLLNLPSGQIWVSGPGSANPWLYKPAGVPQDAWRPTITSVSSPSFGELTLSGTQLNGLTTGADFGDDNKMATNFPLVYLRDGAGHVTYGRTYNFDQMAPRPATAGSCVFSVPSSLPDGSYTVGVVANGVASQSSVPLTFAGPRVSALSGATTSQLFTVKLSQAAPPEGAVVNLMSTRPSVATVPAQLIVPGGKSTAGFAIHLVGAGKTTIKGATAASGAFVVTRDFGWAVSGLAGPVAPSTGTTAIWTLTLDQRAGAIGAVIGLASSNTAAAIVPPSVRVAPGATSATFDVTMVNSSAGLSTITASLAGSTMSSPFGYTLQSLTGSAFPVSGSARWTVTLNAPASSNGVPVNLVSSNPAATAVPSTVTVPFGASSVSFDVALIDPAASEATITASLGGTSMNGVFGYTLQSVSGPRVPASGNTATWTVSLNGPAPPSGVLVHLKSGPAVMVPSSVTIPAGATSTTFDVIMVVAATRWSTVTATLGSVSKSSLFGYVLTTSPVLTPFFVPVGGISTATVNLSANAPVGGLLVTLTNNNPEIASVPGSLVIAEGSKSATFPITGLVPGSDTVGARLGTDGQVSRVTFEVR